MPKACIYALPAFVLSNGSICGCGNELEYIEGEQRYVNLIVSIVFRKFNFCRSAAVS